MQRAAERRAELVENCRFSGDNADGIDHQRIAFVAANGIYPATLPVLHARGAPPFKRTWRT